MTNRGRDVLGTIGSTYASYHARIEEQQRMQGHELQGVRSHGSLELKFIVHAGTYVVQPLATRTHVAGPAVILAHRLLKNRVTDETGLRGYVLIDRRRPGAARMDASAGVSHAEAFADAGAVSGGVFGLARSASQAPA